MGVEMATSTPNSSSRKEVLNMANFNPENPLGRIDLTLADLCNISRVRGPTEIRPEHQPLLCGVDTATESDKKTGGTKKVSRYHLVFPGSGFLKVDVKVEESAPRITSEIIEKYGGFLRVNIEGFESGSFLTNDGGARPYFRAARITPMQTTQK